MTVTAPELTPARGTRRRRPRLLAVVVVAVVLVAVVVAVVVIRAQRGGEQAPYADADAGGRLTLCDRAGHAVTSGRITDHPLVAVVAGASSLSQLGDSGADGAAGAAATLFAYQPRQGAEPSEWTGIALTAPGALGSSVPALHLDPGATTLAQFLGGYPTTWDGWVQLRLVVGTPSAGTLPSYDSIDVQVDGDRWRAADPGTASCPS